MCRRLVSCSCVVFHQAFFFTRPIFFLSGIALVMELFTLAKTEIELDSSIFKMQVDGNKCVATLLHFTNQLADFLGLE